MEKRKKDSIKILMANKHSTWNFVEHFSTAQTTLASSFPSLPVAS
jgi:hypothetical protein